MIQLFIGTCNKLTTQREISGFVTEHKGSSRNGVSAQLVSASADFVGCHWGEITGLRGNDSERFCSGTLVGYPTPMMTMIWFNYMLWRHWGIQIILIMLDTNWIEVGTNNFGLTRLQKRNEIMVTDVTRRGVLFCKCTSLEVDGASETCQRCSSKRFIHTPDIHGVCTCFHPGVNATNYQEDSPPKDLQQWVGPLGPEGEQCARN